MEEEINYQEALLIIEDLGFIPYLSDNFEFMLNMRLDTLIMLMSINNSSLNNVIESNENQSNYIEHLSAQTEILTLILRLNLTLTGFIIALLLITLVAITIRR